MNGPLELTKEVPCSMKSPRIGLTRFFSQDARQEKRSILLQGLQKISVRCSVMAREWKKWEEHKATFPLTQGEVRILKSRLQNLKIDVSKLLELDIKARLVVQAARKILQ